MVYVVGRAEVIAIESYSSRALSFELSKSQGGTMLITDSFSQIFNANVFGNSVATISYVSEVLRVFT